MQLSLPDDVLARCLTYVPSPVDLARAGATCRAWRAIARRYGQVSRENPQDEEARSSPRPIVSYVRRRPCRDEMWRQFVLRLWPSLAPFLPSPQPSATAAASRASSR